MIAAAPDTIDVRTVRRYIDTINQWPNCYNFHVLLATNPNKMVADYYCDHCKQDHDEQRNECRVCGRDSIIRYSQSDSEKETEYQPPEENAETISNVSEATDSPAVNTAEKSGNLLIYLLFLAIIVFLLYIII